MSERECDWLRSLERAVQVTEGQIALAVAVKMESINVQVDRARVLVLAIRDLQRRVAQLESVAPK